MSFTRLAFSRKLFVVVNAIFLTLVMLICIVPFIHLLAISLSSNVNVLAGEVSLWPVGFTWDAYRFLGQKPEFLKALSVSLERVVLGVSISMILAIITAYPLSKDNRKFRFRTVYVWYFATTIFISGGLIPTYMVIRETGILNSIWALVLPEGLSVWYMILLLNFFRNIPKEMEEAAVVDGAGQWMILWRIYLPISIPALATVFLFTIIWHWNTWFDGILYMNSPANYPLQSYLSTLVTSTNVNREAIMTEDLEAMKNLSEKTLRTAQIFLGALPIMMVYPFLQRFFITGITVGSVKE